jgi:predicted RNA methylase
MAKQIDDDVLEVLKSVRCEGPNAILTGQLGRELYVKTNKVLEALGGKWNRKAKAHVFAGDAGELLGDVLTSGEYVDRRKELQFYETPGELASRMCRRADVGHGTTVLEPSAGLGAIAIVARQYGGVVQCIEIDAKMSGTLRDDGFPVATGDFLVAVPTQCFDTVVMNPPFRNGQDMAHVRHAYEFLSDKGTLAAIMSAGMTFRQDRNATEFREWLSWAGGEVEPLPAGTFKASGTMVNAVLVTIRK